MNLILLDARTALASPQDLHPPMAELLNLHKLSYTPEQYLAQLETLNQLAEQYENLHISYRPHSPHNLFLYVKEDAGVIMANASGPVSAFVISDNNLTTAFWDYLLHL